MCSRVWETSIHVHPHLTLILHTTGDLSHHIHQGSKDADERGNGIAPLSSHAASLLAASRVVFGTRTRHTTGGGAELVCGTVKPMATCMN